MQRNHDGTLIIGSHSASMYIRGAVFHVMCGNRRLTRHMPPDSVRDIPWNLLDGMTRTDFGADRRATHITLHFTRAFRLGHWPLYDNRIFIIRSTRNATVRRLLTERRARAAMALPFAMGCHPRLGRDSAVLCLGSDVLKAVAAFL